QCGGAFGVAAPVEALSANLTEGAEHRGWQVRHLRSLTGEAEAPTQAGVRARPWLVRASRGGRAQDEQGHENSRERRRCHSACHLSLLGVVQSDSPNTSKERRAEGYRPRANGRRMAAQAGPECRIAPSAERRWMSAISPDCARSVW